MTKYYLVARNRRDNSFKTINLDEEKTFSEISDNGLPLEKIDLVTIKYKSELDFVQKLYNKGVVDTRDIDLFIMTKNGGKIEYHEVLYNPENTLRISSLREVAKFFLENRRSDANSNIAEFVEVFMKRMYDLVEYRIMVEDDLVKTGNCNHIYREDKNFGFFIENGRYTDIRDLVESFNRYDFCDDKYLNNNFYNSRVDVCKEYAGYNKGRDKIYKKLLRSFNKDISEGQMDLFSSIEDDIPIDKFESDDMIKARKIGDVLFTIEYLPIDSISRDGDEFYMNPVLFEKLPTLEEMNKMNKLVPELFLRKVAEYKILQDMERRTTDMDELRKVKERKTDVYYYFGKYLKTNSEDLDSIHQWATTCDKYLVDESLILDDEKGRTIG